MAGRWCPPLWALILSLPIFLLLSSQASSEHLPVTPSYSNSTAVSDGYVGSWANASHVSEETAVAGGSRSGGPRRSLAEDESGSSGNSAGALPLESFVYVYDLGPKWTYDLFKEEPEWWSTQYEVENEIHRMLAEENLARTMNPEEARLFYVPFFAARFAVAAFCRDWADKEKMKTPFRAAVNATGAAFGELLGRVRSQFPYFNRTNGRDHFSVLSYDHGRCAALPFVPPTMYGEMFFFQLNGDSLVRSTHAFTERDMVALNYRWGEAVKADIPDIPCFMKGTDVVVPPMPFKEGIHPPTSDRPIRVLFRFRAQYSHGVPIPHFGRDVRKDLLELYSDKHYEGWDIGSKPEDVTEGDWQRSIFCVAPPGNSQWTSRPVKAILAGCIPITFTLFNGNPWEDVLDYSKFTLNLDVNKLETLKEEVDSILADPPRLARMQKALGVAQEFLSWQKGLRRGAHALVLRVLRQKVRAVAWRAHRGPSSAVRAHNGDPSMPGAAAAAVAASGDPLFCPICPRVEEPPLGALSQLGSMVHLCTGDAAKPFVAGTYIAPGGGEGGGAEAAPLRYTRLTAFGAEMRHEDDGGQLVTGGWGSDRPHRVMVRVLAFLEDEASQARSAAGGAWGEVADAPLQLRCLFWAGHSRSAQAAPPVYDVEARVYMFGRWHFSIVCPLPPYHRAVKGERGKHSDGAFAVQYGPALQVQLVAALPGAAVFMEPLPLCRADARHVPHVDYNVAPNLWPSGSAPPPGGGSGGGGGGGRQDSWVLSACLRPYAEKGLLAREPYSSEARLKEWVDYHLALGVDRLYLYDRWQTIKPDWLQPYEERGQVVHVPFPAWSEVFYRPKLFPQGPAPDSFPALYDQALAYEHCMMLGRLHNDTWQFHLDINEFLHSTPEEGALLKPLIERVEAKAAEEGRNPVQVLMMGQHNFLGPDWTGEPRHHGAEQRKESGGPILEHMTARCQQPMGVVPGAPWMLKLAVQLHNMVVMHGAQLPGNGIYKIARENLHVRRSVFGASYLGLHPCHPSNATDLARERPPAWVQPLIAKCRDVDCNAMAPMQCWPFCRLPWSERFSD